MLSSSCIRTQEPLPCAGYCWSRVTPLLSFTFTTINQSIIFRVSNSLCRPTSNIQYYQLNSATTLSVIHQLQKVKSRIPNYSEWLMEISWRIILVLILSSLDSSRIWIHLILWLFVVFCWDGGVPNHVNPSCNSVTTALRFRLLHRLCRNKTWIGGCRNMVPDSGFKLVYLTDTHVTFDVSSIRITITDTHTQS